MFSTGAKGKQATFHHSSAEDFLKNRGQVMGLAVGRQSPRCVPVSLPAPHVIYPSKPSCGVPPTKRPFWSHGTPADQFLQVSSCTILACALGTWGIIDTMNQDAGSQERDLIWGGGKDEHLLPACPTPEGISELSCTRSFGGSQQS